MKRSFLVFISIVLVFVSCKNEKKHETKTDAPKVITVEVPSKSRTNEVRKNTINSFDWTKASTLKARLVSDLREHKLAEDSVIVRFLSEYTTLENDFNHILENLSNYDSLNTLAYSQNGIIYKSAIDFKKKIENSGFAIKSSEGYIYISKNTSFIKSEILSLVSQPSKEFIDLYCNEIDTICCDDASIIISKKSLVERILKWGEIIDKSSELRYTKIADSEFRNNLYLLYIGQENTPAFDRDSKQFSQEALLQMQGVIDKYPDSKASKEFKTFIDLLRSDGLTETVKISQFLKNRFYDKSN